MTDKYDYLVYDSTKIVTLCIIWRRYYTIWERWLPCVWSDEDNYEN